MFCFFCSSQILLRTKSTVCKVSVLVAPYCAIPRDYLSDTPLLRAIGFLVSQHGQLGAIPPPPFLSVSPLESMRSGGAIPPLKRGISAILARYHMRTRQNTCDSPLCDTISKEYCAIWGGVSRTGLLRSVRYARRGSEKSTLLAIFLGSSIF